MCIKRIYTGSAANRAYVTDNRTQKLTFNRASVTILARMLRKLQTKTKKNKKHQRSPPPGPPQAHLNPQGPDMVPNGSSALLLELGILARGESVFCNLFCSLLGGSKKVEHLFAANRASVIKHMKTYQNISKHIKTYQYIS